MTEVLANHRQPRLDDLAAVLASCREIFQTMWALDFHEPSSNRPSAAWSDFQMIMTGPGRAMWPMDLNRQPRSVAVKLLHQQADYCFALGLLIEAGEGGDPAATLTRSIVEYGARGFWLLDPDPEVDHRGRCARAVLFELVSLAHAREAASHMPDTPEHRQHRARAKAAFKKMKAVAEAGFADVSLIDEPARWTVEGQRYASWTEITQSWAEAHRTGVSGAALYRLLSVLGHPQGFSATFGLRFDTGGTGVRTIPIDRVEKLVRVALAAYYSALTLLATYTGHRPKELMAWEDRLEAVLPGFFTPEPLAS
ncbi:MAG: hypothetical protein QOE61_749 [Micromonosporaceae bacterium]|nr:hypothetical protein [Micromonosporaceae bacterium]